MRERLKNWASESQDLVEEGGAAKASEEALKDEKEETIHEEIDVHAKDKEDDEEKDTSGEETNIFVSEEILGDENNDVYINFLYNFTA